MNRIIDLDALQLTKGQHAALEDGLCLLELAAYLAGETHTDRPQSVSPVLGRFGRSLNDLLDDTKRQQLKPLAPALPGTARDGLDEWRGYLALDWLIRTYTPAWLELAGLPVEAAQLRTLHRIADLAAAQDAGPVVRASVRSCRVRLPAAGIVTDDAAGAVTWAAAGDGVGVVAWAEAWAAARAAAGAADEAALKPTIDQLQDSAITLFTQMCAPGA